MKKIKIFFIFINQSRQRVRIAKKRTSIHTHIRRWLLYLIVSRVFNPYALIVPFLKWQDIDCYFVAGGAQWSKIGLVKIFLVFYFEKNIYFYHLDSNIYKKKNQVFTRKKVGRVKNSYRIVWCSSLNGSFRLKLSIKKYLLLLKCQWFVLSKSKLSTLTILLKCSHVMWQNWEYFSWHNS